MTSSILEPQEAEAVERRVQPTLAEIRHLVRSLSPAVKEDSSEFAASLVLLAGCSLGHNIDRLAHFTRVPRELVARFGRRLTDNGVWQGGHTVSRWSDGGDPESFRSDVAVAEGKLCRRIDEEGEMEWAPQGYWRKHFEYVAPRDQVETQVTCYQPHVEVVAQDLPYFRSEAVDDEPEFAPEPDGEGPVVATPAEDQSQWGGVVWLGSSTEALEGHTEAVERQDEDVVAAGAPADELFPEAVWLG